MEYKFKITNAEVKGEEVIVTASFIKIDDDSKETVKEIIHAFPRTMEAEEIKGEVGKALELYVSELAQAKEQKVIDEMTENDTKLINNLIEN